MKVRKAIIPAAGMGTRVLPASKAIPKEMLNIVDKPAIQYIVEEAFNSGIEEVLIITNRGKGAIEDHFDHAYELESKLKDNEGKKDIYNDVLACSKFGNIFFRHFFNADTALAVFFISVTKLFCNRIVGNNNVVAVKDRKRLVADKGFCTKHGMAKSLCLLLPDEKDIAEF